MFFSNECWPQLLAPLEIVMSKIFLKYIPIHIEIFNFLYAKKIKIKTRFYALIWMKTAYPCGAADTEEQRFSPADILQNATMLTRRRRIVE